MDSHLLLWLGLPLVVPVVLTRGEERGLAAARLLMAAFGLGALLLGAGSLAPAAIRAHAALSAEAAMFTAVTVGIVVGGLALWHIGDRWIPLFSLPLLAGVLWAGAGTGRPVGLLLGIALGAAPIILGRMLPRRTPMAGGSDLSARPAAVAALGTATAVLVAGGPLLLFLAGVLTAGALAGERGDRRNLFRWLMIVGSAAVPVWLALTIPDSPWIGLGRYLNDAPVPDAAARIIGASGSLLILVLLLPLPGLRLHPGVAAGSASLLAMALSARVTTIGMLAWQPVLTAALVLVAVAGSWRGSRGIVAGALAVLAAQRPGLPSAAAAAVLIVTLLVPLGRVSLRVAPAVVGAVAVASAMTVAVVLGDEVLLACLLVAGLASAASRPSALPVEPSLTERGT